MLIKPPQEAKKPKQYKVVEFKVLDHLFLELRDSFGFYNHGFNSFLNGCRPLCPLTRVLINMSMPSNILSRESPNIATTVNMYLGGEGWWTNQHYMSGMRSQKKLNMGSSNLRPVPTHEWPWHGHPPIIISTGPNLGSFASLINATTRGRRTKHPRMAVGSKHYRYNNIK